MNRFNSVAKKIFLLGISLTIGLVFSEVVAKKILKNTLLDQKVKYAEDKLKEQTHVIGSFDADLGWAYLPSSSEVYSTSEYSVDYSINSDGSRDKEIVLVKSPGELRAVALGESTVFGEGVEYGKRFTEVMENLLKSVDVINMGVWGFGADQSLLQLERDGFRLKPDVVILFAIKGFFERCKLYQRLQALKPRFVLSDDKDDIVLQDIPFIKDNLLINTGPDMPSPSAKVISKKLMPSFFERSSLLALWSGKKRLSEIQQKVEGEDKSRWQKIYDQLDEDSKRVAAYNDRDFEKLIFLLLKRYEQMCKKNSADFILVYIDEDKEYFLKYLSNSCQSLGIKCLSLSDVLLNVSKNRPLRFNIDPHYNEGTHQIIGEYVADYLLKEYNLTSRQ